MTGTLRDLEVRHLIALDAVAAEGTFGRAAERLGYTQSAVSQQIAALERLVGEKVFDRPGGPRPVELTPFGRHLLETARDLLARVDALARELERLRTGEIGRLVVGTFQSVSATVLPLVVERMRREHPDVEIVAVESDIDDELIESLAAGELDVSFVCGDWGPRFETVHLFDDPFVVLAPPGRFEPGPVRVDDLADLPFVGQQANSCQLLNEAGLRDQGLDPQYVFRSNDNGTVAAMVRAGMGVAVLPRLCVEPEDHRITIHPIDPPLPDRRIGLAWRAGRTASPVADRFTELAIEASRSLTGRMAPVGG